MFKTVKDLYLGNIPLCERSIPSGSPLRRLSRRLEQQKEELDQQLDEDGKAQFNTILDTLLEMDGVTAEENFILGFRLGVRLMAECLTGEAAAKIDQGIGKAAPQELPAEPQEKRTMTTFQPYIGQRRKPGTGCISQISPNCWEGRYSPMWPDGKKHSRNVYAKTREECEALLPGLIAEMKAEIRAIKRSGDLGAIPDGISDKKKRIAAYMRQHPEITSKHRIAREVGVGKDTVRRYYDEIQSGMRLGEYNDYIIA